jgi:hypothetical protein
MSQLQSALQFRCLPVSEYRLDVCVMPLIVPILRSTGHIRNFVTSDVSKYIDFSNAF